MMDSGVAQFVWELSILVWLTGLTGMVVALARNLDALERSNRK